ncbi:DUF5988 family protein [Phytohabitans suffuscus]|uniref:Uncharacterized protein n=1 Tax=Phytohabitans suffuscus TaxID=624315 RepID=A0A6F8YER7_9ACTN|nr:DUF5988 family protein [Phytohabitans suffuscus]BCB84560.1 hypothetical protein Psuf_018730 [Phytohabitans suffuscus]
MSELADSTTRDDNFVEAALEGGPADLPPQLRRTRVTMDADVVKVPYLGGYEHFARVGAESPGSGHVLFRWSARTRIAE